MLSKVHEYNGHESLTRIVDNAVEGLVKKCRFKGEMEGMEWTKVKAQVAEAFTTKWMQMMECQQ